MTASPTAAAARPPFDAVIFDLDGVVTNTALVHQAAWKEAFDRILQDPRIPGTADRSPFTKADYRTYVDGLPREEGVLKFLASRGCASTVGLRRTSPAPGRLLAWAA
ncbi:hypothetical protein [Pseudarthrobacter phenanthrenivorans]|uniref:hypothetical protein n=1 Tax=Pseudarthrobacter phenanthrenivorans TaxID=361575 RepID=UPI0020B6F6CA|nr:hypothetical protein [Pseudarthrobacter phenanthrenivorans]